MRAMNIFMLKSLNNLIKEKEVTEAIRNLIQFEGKAKQLILSKHNQPLKMLCSICVFHYVKGGNKLAMPQMKGYIK